MSSADVSGASPPAPSFVATPGCLIPPSPARVEDKNVLAFSASSSFIKRGNAVVPSKQSRVCPTQLNGPLGKASTPGQNGYLSSKMYFGISNARNMDRATRSEGHRYSRSQRIKAVILDGNVKYCYIQQNPAVRCSTTSRIPIGHFEPVKLRVNVACTGISSQAHSWRALRSR